MTNLDDDDNLLLQISGTVNDSIVDGPGLRFTIFTQGCDHHCKNCHNPQTHDKQGGKMVNLKDLLKQIDNNPLLDGVTFSGGEPLLHVKPLTVLAKKLKERNLHVMLYTGFIWEDLLHDNEFLSLIQYVDLVVDGPFKEELKSLDLLYCGSSNQRIINVQSLNL